MSLLFIDIIYCQYYMFHYSQSSHKRQPREFRKVVATRAGRLREVDYDQSVFPLRDSHAKQTRKQARIVT